MADAKVQSIELQIKGQAKGAKKSLDDLIETLGKLKQATKGGCGLSAVAEGLEKVRSSGNGISAPNDKSAKSFIKLGAKITTAAVSLKKAGKVIASWIKESNDYVENLNLFTVAMGEYAASAKQYAEEVGDLMGIDPSDWMRSQGVFMTMATGFGVANDRAATLSQQLTQLGYDLSSFYNIDVTEAMTKLRSGLAGELEPLRALGYDLSKAKLEATALSLGIDRAVDSMTQAEKAELRYYAIMTQVTTVQGDMARTLNAPANQLRVLAAQAKQAARALGNIFIPALNAVLPYAIAFLKVVREIANGIANLFGFTLPEMDYSGMDGLASGGENASDALDEATGSAKKLKKTLLGIDELNVLTDTSSSGTGASAVGGGSFDFDLPEYDFMGEITKQTNKAYKTMKKLLKPVERLIDYLIEYKEIVLIGAGLVALGKLWGALKSLWTWFTGIGIVSQFIGDFKLIKNLGHTTLQSFGGAFSQIKNNLTGMQKAVIVAVAAFAEFSVVKTNIREIALGCENVGAKIIEMGVVAGIAATAMYAALGPAGLAVAAVTFLVGAIVGLNEATEQTLTNISSDVFYNGSVSITELGDAFDKLMESVVNANQPIVDNQEKISEARENIKTTVGSIESIATAISIGATTASEKIPEITELFGSLRDDTEATMTQIYNNIVMAIGGSFGAALLEAGKSIPEVLEALAKIRGEGSEALVALQTELENLKIKFADGEITEGEFTTRMMEIARQMSGLTGETVNATSAFEDIVSTMGSINWKDEDTKDNFFAGVSEAASTAKESINVASDSIVESLETMKTWTTDPVMLNLLDEMITIAESDRQRQLSEVDAYVTSIYDRVQVDLLNKTQEVVDKAKEKWDDMSWFGRVFSGSSGEEDYVRRAIENYRKNIASPVSDDISDSYSELGINGAGWANDAMSDILNALFSLEYGGYAQGMVYEYQSNLDDAIDEVLEQLGIDIAPVAEATGASITASIGNGVLAAPLSPIANDLISSAFDTTTGYNQGYSFGQNLGSGVAKALKNTSLPTLKGTVAMGTDGTASIKFKAYAMGGFPADGEMFVAREAGPELVGTIGNRSAVVNNDQIVESVSKGVYQAVSSAMGGANGSQVVEAKVNDKVLFEVVVSRARQEAMRTGHNPLLGGA